MKFLLFEVMFLANTFHGRGHDGREWPVSPMRVFSASTEPAGWRGGEEQHAAMRWLERLGAPEIVAPDVQEMKSYVVSQPSNNLDNLDWRQWEAWLDRRNREKNVVLADMFPSYVDDETPLTYVWRVEEAAGVQQHVEVLQSIAYHVHALGRSEDTVACRVRLVAEDEVVGLRGRRWFPSKASWEKDSGTCRLRVPVPGSFDSLEQRFEEAQQLVRLGVVRLPSEARHALVTYHRGGVRKCHLVGLQDREGHVLRVDPRDAITIAAMLRHAANETAKKLGFDDDWVRRYICGHVEKGDSYRVAYLPMPSLGKYASGDISQVMLVEPSGAREDRFASIVESLRRSNDPVSSGCGKYTLWLGGGDWEATWRYRKESTVFTSVSPVILSGYDDRSYAKAEKMATKSLAHAGLLHLVKNFSLTRTPNWRGSHHASKYAVSDKLTPKSRYHMRLEFSEKVKGPLLVGDGRYRGLGLFAAT